MNGRGAPSPSKVAAQVGRRPAAAPRWAGALGDLFADLDIEPRQVPPDTQGPEESDVRCEGLLVGDAGAACDFWCQLLNASKWPTVAEALLLEVCASVDPKSFAERLPSGYAYRKTLHLVRTRAAIVLYDYAREINWRRPILFVGILKAARSYLRDCVANESLTREAHKKDFTGRLGVATTLISRFESVELSELEEAISALYISLNQGNNREAAVPYLLEALCRHYDLSGDRGVLEDGAKLVAPSDVSVSSRVDTYLAAPELLLRLYDLEPEATGRADRLADCRQYLDQVRDKLGDDSERQVRWLLLDAMVTTLQDFARVPSGIRGVQLPFVFRDDRATNTSDLPVEAMIARLTPLAEDGEPLSRGVLADLVERVQGAATELERLQTLVRLRGSARWVALADERSRLLVERDRLRIAGLTNDRALRNDALTNLIALSERDSCAVAATVLLARDVEVNRGVAVAPRVEWCERQEEISRWLYAGNVRSLLAIAADRALQSPDLTRSLLGGRAGVVTVSDYFDVVGGTFVFKETTALVWKREIERSREIEVAIEKGELGGVCGVVDHLSPALEEIASLDPQAKISTVRRFETGVVLAERVAALPSEEKIELLCRAAEFLAFIHGVGDESPVTRVRRQLWVGEIGWWLRSIDPVGAPELFAIFWELCSSMPSIRRRDAHALNWLLGEDGRLLAVDLEAIGWRPLGYEVAQLTEDCYLLPASDMGARRRVLEQYLVTLGLSLTEDVWVAFEAAVFARAVRRLTAPSGYGEALQHARGTLASLRQSTSDDRVRGLCERVLRAWNASRGLESDDFLTVGPDDGARRRLSKSMSYHLRHSEEAPRDDAGWVSMTMLAELLGVTPLTVSLVATDFREPRFEVDGGKVRATYGHSRPVVVDDAESDITELLFHATFEGLAEQVLFVQGLAPMSRQFVHMSSSPEAALVAGRRHGVPLLLAIDASRVDELRHAAGDTYVAPAVGAEALSVVPQAWLVRRDMQINRRPPGAL